MQEMSMIVNICRPYVFRAYRSRTVDLEMIPGSTRRITSFSLVRCMTGGGRQHIIAHASRHLLWPYQSNRLRLSHVSEVSIRERTTTAADPVSGVILYYQTISASAVKGPNFAMTGVAMMSTHIKVLPRKIYQHRCPKHLDDGQCMDVSQVVHEQTPVTSSSICGLPRVS